MTHPDAAAFVSRFQGRSVLVIGDLMLDHFVVGRVTRISPEAPVPIVRFEREYFRLGGSANVAHNVVALGAHAVVAGVVGDDQAGGHLAADLAGLGVDVSGIVTDPRRPTTRKLRVVTERNQQVARIDYETDRDLAPDVEHEVVRLIGGRLGSIDAVVISDYLKGTVTKTLAARAIDLARIRRVPLIVDPKVPHIDYYRGARLITPNHHEAEAVTLLPIRTSEEARVAARAFRQRAGCEAVLVTRGEHGMWLLDPDDTPDESGQDLPAAAREVSDVTGAGDTVVATIALGLAAGAPLPAAATLANHAAGVVVAKFGPATISPEELVTTFERDARV